MIVLLASGRDATPAYSQRYKARLENVSRGLVTRIGDAEKVNALEVRNEPLYCLYTLPAFYKKREYRPAWTGDAGPLPHAEELARCISGAEAEGLRPDDYHLKAIEDHLEALRQEDWTAPSELEGLLVDLEMLLTDAFLTYGSHLLAGRVDPRSVDPEWQTRRREIDLTAVLDRAVDNERIEEALKRLAPFQPGYSELKRALREYRGIATKGGWPVVGGVDRLDKGTMGADVASLRARLALSGDLMKDSPPPWDESGGMGAGAPADSSWSTDTFDEAVRRAVIKFQERHGLDADGVVGPKTRAALNTPLSDRIEQIEVNLERYRWLPHDLGRRHILVNIPGFDLGVYEDGERVIYMRVIVGQRLRRTPVFSDVITYLVLNPYWQVPETIAIEDILPSARKDSTYLADKGIRVFEGWTAGASEIPRELIDWSSLNDGNFRYKFVQDPGSENSLGRIKFMFPNEFDIYLHDTPARSLFYESERTFSSGCIRIERPIELALYLLGDRSEWTREKILATLETSDEVSVRVPEPIPIHLLYWTAFVDEDGSVNFRNDIYERDERLSLELRKPLAGSGSAHGRIGANRSE